MTEGRSEVSRSPWGRDGSGTFEIDVVPNPSTTERDGPVVVTSDDAATERRESADDRRLMTLGAVGAVVALGIAIAFGFGGSDDETERSETSLTTPDETIMAPTTIGDPDSDGEDDERDGDADDDTGDDTGDDPAGDPGDGGSTAGDTSGGRPSVLPLRVDLPPALAGQPSPTEIVALTTDGRLATVSLPSGTLRIDDLDGAAASNSDFYRFESNLVVSPSATAVRTDSTTVHLVGRTGESRIVTTADLDLDLDGEENGEENSEESDDGGDGGVIALGPVELVPVGWLRAADGTERFVLRSFEPSGRLATALVGLDGEIRVLGIEQEGNRPNGRFGARYADGTGYYDEGGQVYRLDGEGAVSLVGPGELVAVVDSGPIVRRCDATTECTVEIVAADGGRPIEPALVSKLDGGFVSPSLSPDGRTLATIEFGPTGPEIALTALDGDAPDRLLAIDGFPRLAIGWVGDGAGVVTTAGSQGDGSGPFTDGIQFFPTDPQLEPTVFADAVGRVANVATRFPAEELPPPTTVEVGELALPAVAARLPTVVIADRRGQVRQLDFAAGSVTEFRTGLPGTWANGRPGQVIATDDSVVVLDEDGEDGYVVGGDASSTLPAWPPGVRYAAPTAPGDDTVWAPVPGPDGARFYRRVDRSGTIVDEGGLPVPADAVIGGDVVGGIVYERAGDVWLSTGSDTRRLTTGALVASNSEQAIAHECDDEQRCRIVRVIPATDVRRTIESATFGSAVVGATPDRDVSLSGSLSPDGRTALVELGPGSGGDWAFADLQSNELVTIETPDDGLPIVWSADSSAALFVAGGDLLVWDRATGTVEPIDVPGVVVALGIGSAR